MKYLSPHQVLFLHARLIEETGGSHGVRDMGLLLAALGRPKATFEGKDLHPTIYQKAAALSDSMINNHPFVDGNKRTGIGAAVLFLSLNGYVLTASNQELLDLTMEIAQKKTAIETIANWFERHSNLRSTT
ncbi:MAG: type II toxin-antitoxin system death-on-curing family toxin [Anaerolineales bacterium]|nr:MAG: type II toxin-antitoxin system death-on-curing family toxin [Anaerolineales bacterium]